MKKVLTIGSVTRDIFLTPLRQKILQKKFFALPFGEKVRTKNLHQTFGGGAANCAANFAKFKISPAVLGAIGDNQIGAEVIENLRARKISTENLQKIENCETGFSVILNAFSGERTVLFSKGANEKIGDFKNEILKNFDGVHLCHLSGESKNIFQKIETFFVQNPQKFLSFNPGKEQIEKGAETFAEFLKVVDALFLNLQEAREFCGVENLNEIFQRIFKLGFRGVFAVTDGRAGATICDGEKILKMGISEKFPRIDTLGAGDAFASSASAQLLRGEKNLVKIFKIATMQAASVVAHFGAQAGLLPRAEIEKILENEKIENSISNFV